MARDAGANASKTGGFRHPSQNIVDDRLEIWYNKGEVSAFLMKTRAFLDGFDQSRRAETSEPAQRKIDAPRWKRAGILYNNPTHIEEQGVLALNKKRNGKTVAVIDIGSNMLKMRVAQLQNGEIKDLDRLEYPIQIGHEVFNDGKISFESLKELSSILRGYSQVMLEYGVAQYKIVATTVFREAQNRAYIADQLKIQNDMTIEILEDDQEKTLIYSEILRALSGEGMPKIDTALVSYIGTGSIGLALYDGDLVTFSQNIPMGSLKLHDMLGGIQEETTEFATVLNEYLDGVIGRIRLPTGGRVIDSIVITGNEIELIAKICGVPLKKGRYLIEVKLVNQLYERLSAMTTERISERYQLPEEQVEILYTALALYTRVLKLTQASCVISPKIELWDAVVRQLLFSKSKAEYDEHVRRNALSCAKVMAAHYYSNPEHLETVREYAAAIFDRTKKIHGLSSKKRLLLELAAILHESGYYVNSKHHLRSTFDLIKNTDIYGLTDEEVLLIAHIARYTDFFLSQASNRDYIALSEKNKLVVAKLVAIFRLANALDKSGRQKLQSIRIRLSDDALVITGVSDANVLLERWAFQECAPYFEEVFGVKPQLVIKSLLF